MVSEGNGGEYTAGGLAEHEAGLETTSISLPLSAREAIESLATMHGWSFAAEVRAALRAHLLRYGLADTLPEAPERARARRRES